MGFIFSGITFSGGFEIQPTFVPDAPTIGTATATSATTATVTFTAPSYGGSTTITTYTATSSPGGITGTVSQSGSGTITVSGLSQTTSYTFTVTATNSSGASVASSASNSITTPSAGPSTIGQSWGGGYYAGQISTTGNGVATHYLIVAPFSSGNSNSKQQKTANTATAGADSLIDGPANSAAMNNAEHPAAQFCEGLTIGGYTDWYLPAKNELEICYYNLRPGTTYNNYNPGLNNVNAVPPRNTDYTNSDPPLTSATIFRTGGSEAFTELAIPYYYWSSTTYSSSSGWRQSFRDGFQQYNFKTGTISARAVRRIPV